MSTSMSLPTWRSELQRVSGVLNSPNDAKVLIEEAAGRRVTELYPMIDIALTDQQRTILDKLVIRRRTGEPLQHVVGHWPFRNVELLVDARALIPRPETEQVVEVALRELELLRRVAQRLGETFAANIVDLGTGTGAISCAIVDEVSDVSVLAIDCSSEALELARQNIERLAPGDHKRITLLEGSWFTPLRAEREHNFDLIIANPPYLSNSEWNELDHVVRDYDPKGALVAGETGLEDLETIIREAPAYLSKRAVVVCEIGATQGEEARELGVHAGASSVVIEPDLVGRDRVLVARFFQ